MIACLGSQPPQMTFASPSWTHFELLWSARRTGGEALRRIQAADGHRRDATPWSENSGHLTGLNGT